MGQDDVLGCADIDLYSDDGSAIEVDSLVQPQMLCFRCSRRTSDISQNTSQGLADHEDANDEEHGSDDATSDPGSDVDEDQLSCGHLLALGTLAFFVMRGNLLASAPLTWEPLQSMPRSLRAYLHQEYSPMRSACHLENRKLLQGLYTRRDSVLLVRVYISNAVAFDKSNDRSAMSDIFRSLYRSPAIWDGVFTGNEGDTDRFYNVQQVCCAS